MKLRASFLQLILITSITLSAQTETSQPPFKAMIYGGTGLIIPSGDMNKNSMVGSGVNFRFGYFQSFVKSKSDKIRYGLEVRLEYSKFKKDLQAPASVVGLRYENGSSSPASVSLKQETAKKKPDAFGYLAGPSIVYSSGRYFLNGSLLFGYGSVAQESFIFSDTLRSAIDPMDKEYKIFYSATHETNNGFLLSPGIKGGIRISPYFSVFLAADYNLGSKQEFTDRMFVPAGSPDPGTGTYDLQEMKNGILVDTERKSRYRALVVSANLAITWK